MAGRPAVGPENYTWSELRHRSVKPNFVMFNCHCDEFYKSLSDSLATQLTEKMRGNFSSGQAFPLTQSELNEIVLAECKNFLSSDDDLKLEQQRITRIKGFKVRGLVSFQVDKGATVIRKEVWDALEGLITLLRTGNHLEGKKVPSNTSELILGIQSLLNARFGPTVGIDDLATLSTAQAASIMMMKTAMEETTDVVPCASSPSTDQVGSNGRDPEPLEPDDRWRQEVGIEFSWGDDAFSDIQMTLDDDWLPAKVSLAHAASFLRMKEDLLRNLLQTKRIRRYRYGFSSFDLVKLGIELGGCHIQTLTLWSNVFSEDYRWDDEQTPTVSYSGVAINGVVFFDPEYEGDYFDFKVEREFFVWGMAFRPYILGLKSTGRKIELFDPRSIQGSPNFED